MGMPRWVHNQFWPRMGMPRWMHNQSWPRIDILPQKNDHF
jgi:hypothetical protein